MKAQTQLIELSYTMYRIILVISAFGVVASLYTTKAKEDVRIVGGEDIDITEAPYQVSILKNGRHTCGGAVIGVDMIITAAHCIYNTIPRDYSVRVGSSSNQMGGKVYPVADMVWHPNFSYNKMDSDIALLRLAKSLDFGDRVAAVDLLMSGEEIEDGGITMVSGWGNLREGGGYPSTLQMVLVPTVNSFVCRNAYSPLYSITPTMLCAGVAEGGKDACQGDSGGPMVYNGRLAGVVSWGLGCARPNYPGVYAKVSALRDWIDKSITQMRRSQLIRPFPFMILDKLFKETSKTTK